MNNKIPAVEKTLALLELLSASEKGMTQAEFKKELGISMSTCYRILQTLLAKKWVRKDREGVYHPGCGLSPFFRGLQERILFPEALQELLEQTSRKYEIGCKLSIRQHREQCTVLRSEPAGSETTPVFSLKRSFRFPVIEGSVGAVLLAEEDREKILTLVEMCQDSIGEKVQPQLIFDRIDFLRKNGYCCNENNRWHICAYSSPVRDADGGILAALTFLLPRMELDGIKQDQYISLLREVSRKCEIIMQNQGE